MQTFVFELRIELRGVLNFKQNFLTDLQVVLVLVFLNRINIKRIGLLKDKYRINGQSIELLPGTTHYYASTVNAATNYLDSFSRCGTARKFHR
jgi:hypothetical protein